MSAFVHAQGIKTIHAGVGVKKWQNSVHVVVECPLWGLKLRLGIETIQQLYWVIVIFLYEIL